MSKVAIGRHNNEDKAFEEGSYWFLFGKFLYCCDWKSGLKIADTAIAEFLS